MIQVYAINIAQLEPQSYNTLYTMASPERRHRADRCRNLQDAYCCITAGALLRHAVKRHLGRSEYELETGIHGKPRLKDEANFHFNISHSGPWVVLACGNTEVGIDAETVRMDEKKEKIARRFFTPKEQEYIFQCAEDSKARFFQIWTAKESYLKYLGTGLQKPLNSFCVRSMAEPRFFTHWLEDCCMTLCTEEPEFNMEIISSEELI